MNVGPTIITYGGVDFRQIEVARPPNRIEMSDEIINRARMEIKNSALRALLERYKPANARICNCGRAYETRCGNGIINGMYRSDLWACEYGCSANQLRAIDYIAARALEDLQLK